jgi:hypothetical protein
MAIGYAKDVRPQFRQIDIDHMKFFCDLSSYDDVKTNAQEILGRLKATDDMVMPPENSAGPWPAVSISTFEDWIVGGCQPQSSSRLRTGKSSWYGENSAPGTPDR